MIVFLDFDGVINHAEWFPVVPRAGDYVWVVATGTRYYIDHVAWKVGEGGECSTVNLQVRRAPP
jgi:hypothetical protein